MHFSSTFTQFIWLYIYNMHCRLLGHVFVSTSQLGKTRIMGLFQCHRASTHALRTKTQICEFWGGCFSHYTEISTSKFELVYCFVKSNISHCWWPWFDYSKIFTLLVTVGAKIWSNIHVTINVNLLLYPDLLLLRICKA